MKFWYTVYRQVQIFFVFSLKRRRWFQVFTSVTVTVLSSKYLSTIQLQRMKTSRFKPGIKSPHSLNKMTSQCSFFFRCFSSRRCLCQRWRVVTRCDPPPSECSRANALLRACATGSGTWWRSFANNPSIKYTCTFSAYNICIVHSFNFLMPYMTLQILVASKIAISLFLLV